MFLKMTSNFKWCIGLKLFLSLCVFIMMLASAEMSGLIKKDCFHSELMKMLWIILLSTTVEHFEIINSEWKMTIFVFLLGSCIYNFLKDNFINSITQRILIPALYNGKKSSPKHPGLGFSHFRQQQ